MSYYEDLTAYSYYTPGKLNNEWNVGWLDEHHPFLTGPIDPELCEKLLKLCHRPVRQMRGYHYCSFCKGTNVPVTVESSAGVLKLGAAEIRVEGRDGRIYACPDLIYHYVKVHNYRPPEDFLEAIRSVTV